MLKDTGMTTSHYCVITHPGYCFTNIFNILTCAGYDQITLFNMEKMRG